jgi:hypothetical protein
MTLPPRVPGPRVGEPPLHPDPHGPGVGGLALPEPLRSLADRSPVLLIFLRHFG